LKPVFPGTALFALGTVTNWAHAGDAASAAITRPSASLQTDRCFISNLPIRCRMSDCRMPHVTGFAFDTPCRISTWLYPLLLPLTRRNPPKADRSPRRPGGVAAAASQGPGRGTPAACNPFAYCGQFLTTILPILVRFDRPMPEGPVRNRFQRQRV